MKIENKFFNLCSCNNKKVVLPWIIYKEGKFFVFECTICKNQFKTPLDWYKKQQQRNNAIWKKVKR